MIKYNSMQMRKKSVLETITAQQRFCSYVCNHAHCIFGCTVLAKLAERDETSQQARLRFSSRHEGYGTQLP